MATEILRNRDLEYDDLERHDLLGDGDAHFHEDEVRNTTISTILAGLAGVLCLVAMILTWILYFRERTRTFLWHAIFLIFAMLFAFACAAWAASTGTLVKKGSHNTNSMFTLIVFIGSLILFVYMMAETLWFVFYRHTHFSYLVGLRADNNLWNARMTSGSSFEEGWRSSRRMMWWVTFFTFIAGLIFAFVAYTVKSVVQNRFQLTRIGLYIACLGAVVAGFIVVYWAEEAFEYQHVAFQVYDHKIPQTLKGLAIAGIVFAVINALVNLFKVKLGYFIMGVFGVVLIILLTCASSLQWRDVRDAQQNNLSISCAAALAPTHERNLDDVCINGGKYLPAGATCTKQYLVNRWESGNTQEVRSLNPSCCELGKAYYNYPFMLLAFWSLILLLTIGLMILFDFYLSDTSEYLTWGKYPNTAIDYILTALVILTAIGWLIYFLARKANKIEHGTNAYGAAYFEPEKNKIDGFDLVPNKIVNNANPPTDNQGCLNYTTATMAAPKFSTTDATCTSNCVERVAILTRNAFITPPIDYKGAAVGSQARLNFFPGCTNSANSYLFIYGTNKQITDALNNIKLCPTSFQEAPVVNLYHDQVPAASINNNGLLNGESSADSLTNADDASCLSGFDQTDTCEGKCRVISPATNNFGLITVKGNLFYINQAQRRTDVPGNLGIRAYANNKRIGNGWSILADGVFLITNIPRFTDTDYTLQLRITDPNNVFLDKNVDIRVERQVGAKDEISAGSIRLITEDGKVCAVGDTTCISAQKLAQGSVTFNVKDGSTSDNFAQLKDVQIQMTRQFVNGGDFYRTISTDGTGTAKATNVDYGSYTAVYSKPGFFPYSARIDLQEPNQNPPPVILRPSDDENAMRIVAEMNDPSVDFDLKMNVRSDKGKSCQTSPYNKYCAYAGHLNDVVQGTGQEVISIKRLAVAEYLTFVAPANAYSGTCAAADVANGVALHFETIKMQAHMQTGSWNWDVIRRTRPIETLGIAVHTISGAWSNYTDSAGNTFLSIFRNAPVETVDQSAVAREVIGRNGQAIAAGKRTTITTDVRGTTTTVTNNEDAGTTKAIGYNQALGNMTGTNITYKTTTSDGASGTRNAIVQTFTYQNGSTASSKSEQIDVSKSSGDTVFSIANTTRQQDTNGSTVNSTNKYAKRVYANDRTEYDFVTVFDQNGMSDPVNSSFSNTTKTVVNDSDNSNTSYYRTRESFVFANKTSEGSGIDEVEYNGTDYNDQDANLTSYSRAPGGDNVTRLLTIRRLTNRSVSPPRVNEIFNETTTTLFNNGQKRSDSYAENLFNSENGVVKSAYGLKNVNYSLNSMSLNTTTDKDGYQYLINQSNTTANNTDGDVFARWYEFQGKNDSTGLTVSMSNDQTNLRYANGATLANVQGSYDSFYTNGTNFTQRKVFNKITPKDTGLNTTYTISEKNFTNNPDLGDEQTNTTYNNSNETAAGTWSNITVVIATYYKSNSSVTTQTNSSLYHYTADSTTKNTSWVNEKKEKVSRRRLAEYGVHVQGSSTNNYMIASCFTGYGDSSVVELNKYQSAEPKWEDCTTYRDEVKPATTLAKLRKDYDANK